ncbi:MAG: hypothetical protein ACYTF1_01690 [Planctomycetota bacterium]
MYRSTSFNVFVILCVAAFAVNTALAGPLAVHSGNSRFIDDGSGRAILLTGAHTWAEFQTYQSESFDYADWLDELVSHDHNFMRGWTWEDDYYTPTIFTKPGSLYDLDSYNSSFITRFKDRIEDAADEGLYLSIMLFQGWSVDKKPSCAKTGGYRSPDPWPQNPYKASNNNETGYSDPTRTTEFCTSPSNSYDHGIAIYTLSSETPYPPAVDSDILVKQKNYVKKMIDELNGYDNIIWEIGNEMEDTTINFQYHIIDYIKSYEAGKSNQHLVWMNGDTTDIFSSSCHADVVSPNGSTYRTAPPVSTGSKVVICDSDHTDPLQVTYDWAWRNFARANHPILMDCSYDDLDWWQGGSFDPTNSKWPAMWDAMGRIRRYAEIMDLANSVPQNGGTSPCNTGYCLYDSGDTYMCYQHNNGANVTVNLPAGKYAYEIYNCSSNTVAETGIKTSTGGNETINNPTSTDVAVFLAIMPDDAVSIDLGQFDDQRGIFVELSGPTTSDTDPAYIGGRDCRTNRTLSNDKYIYFDVDDDWAYQGSEPSVKISFDYYDSGTVTMNLKYDGTGNSWALAGEVTRTNTNTWKTKTWEVTDAYFGNRQNSDNDIRIYGGPNEHFYIANLTVEAISDSVSVDMYINDVEDGLARPDPEPSNGDTANKTKGGVECRRNKTPYSENLFFYFCIDDDWAYGGNKSDVYISYDYYVNNTDSYIRLQYDAGEGSIYKNTPRIYPSISGSWQDTYVHITDADFSNRQAGGADFRVKRAGGNAIWMNIVEVSTSAP